MTELAQKSSGVLENAYITAGVQEASATYEVRSPATGAVVGTAAACGAAEARAAADLAVTAFENWKARTAFERSEVLRRWYELILEDEEALGPLIATEMGKALKEARGEVTYAANFVKFYAEEAIRIYGDTVPAASPDKRIMVTRQPVGPVFAITPWNFPAGMITRKAAPALAAGCSVVLKPAEQTPFTALRLAELWLEAGGEPGTLQVLPAADPREVSETLIEDSRIRKLAFTGSTEVGKLLYAQAAPTMKRISLELGGHAPFVVFADADLDVAVEHAVGSKFRNAGQTCVCANRLIVHEDVAEEFASRFAAAASRLRVGDPLAETTDLGPLVSQAGFDKVNRHVTDALTRGAEAVTGGKPAEVEGGSDLFYTPTVLTGVTEDMLIMNEETFGPVAPIITFKDDSEAVRLANDTPFGLAAYMFTRDVGRAFRVSEALDYGIVGVNDGMPSVPHAPFGGVKESGLGREGGKWGIEEFLDVKYVSLGL